ncbi:MAG: Glu-tRNA(Gln) amidotransferase subunit GatD [archaeon]|nr:MAG: Glu-tRNA(Gln) amidotransferase subunit GatD [archaeon]
MDELPGYSGVALRLLKGAKARVGDVLSADTDWGKVTGTLVPRYAGSASDAVVIKLPSGYNIGLSPRSLRSVRVVAKGEKPSFSAPEPPKADTSLPKVLVLGTGGTIASRVDYRTGAVHPAVTSSELHSLVPELSKFARLQTEILFNVFSENIGPSHWTKIARRVVAAVASRVDGVVVTHGTDTMGYSAAALSFALSGVPIPVVLVGAQRSSDRPSSDGPLNLVAGVSAAATAPFSGVYVAMHLDESDDTVALHRGTRVRKDHTSSRDAFESIGVPPASFWRGGRLEGTDAALPPRGDIKAFHPRPGFDSRVSLIKSHPSMQPSIFSWAGKEGLKGLVLEGTGLGHVGSNALAGIRRLVKGGVMVCMTSQCLNGRVNMNVYDTGRDLLEAGVVPLEDMLPETALVKAMWALRNSKSSKGAAELMRRNLQGETTSRTLS